MQPVIVGYRVEWNFCQIRDCVFVKELKNEYTKILYSCYTFLQSQHRHCLLDQTQLLCTQCCASYGTMYSIYYDNLTLICLHNGMQLSSTQSIAAAVIFCVLLLSLLLLACHASYIAKDCKRKRLQTAVHTMYNGEKECM